MLSQTRENFFLILVVITFLLVSGVALILGGKKSVEKTVIVDKAAELETAEPGKTELTGEVLFDFPVFPQYPGSEVVNSYKKEEDEVVGYSAKWFSNDGVSNVAGWYVDRLQELGWTILISPELDIELAEQFLQARKGDLTVNIIIEEEESGLTNIEIDFPVQPRDSYVE